jgi:SAM-dependent methyltransferase
MKNFLSETINYYNLHTKEFVDRTLGFDMSSSYTPFLALIPLNGLILDAGCGSGRDAKYFLKKGYRVNAFDASLKMAKTATKNTGIPVQHLYFHQLEEIEKYDGIWANASLLHVPKNELKLSLAKIYGALKHSGVWFLTFKWGRFEGMKQGRYFTYMTEEALWDMLKQLSYIEKVHEWKETVNETVWLHLIVRKSQ